MVVAERATKAVQPLFRRVGCHCQHPLGSRRYTAVMTDDGRIEDTSQGREDTPELPRHLGALVGALNGPSDLGRNHDKYLAYPDRNEASGAASA